MHLKTSLTESFPKTPRRRVLNKILSAPEAFTANVLMNFTARSMATGKIVHDDSRDIAHSCLNWNIPTANPNTHARTVQLPGRTSSRTFSGTLCTGDPRAHPSERCAVRSPGAVCISAADGLAAFAASDRGGARFTGRRSHFDQLIEHAPLERRPEPRVVKGFSDANPRYPLSPRRCYCRFSSVLPPTKVCT